MIDVIQLPTETLKEKRIEIHFEFQEQFHFRSKPAIPYVYGIIDIRRTIDYTNKAILVTMSA
jgi:hypothetical protein